MIKGVTYMDLNEVIDKDFSGCISVKKKGTTIFQKAYGYAHLSDRILNKLDTRFATASAGKVFVAVAVLQLIEQGKLKLTDNIGSLLDFDLKEIDPDITVEELLTHTSGIPDYFDESVMEEYDELWKDFPNYKIRSNRDLLPLFIDKPMMYPRKEKFFYNNTGFVVLALIIESVTYMDFDMYLKKNVFNMAGMDRTGYYELDRLPEGCADNYIYDEKRKEFYKNIYSVDAKGTGAGGAFTTVCDVERFWEALINYRLLSKDMTERMLSQQSISDGAHSYGYGIWLRTDFGDEMIPYFMGSDPGVSFVSAYNRKEDMIITVVSNFEDNVWKIWRNVRSRCLQITDNR